MLAVLFKCCLEPLQRFERLNSTLNVGCPNVKSTKNIACYIVQHEKAQKQMSAHTDRLRRELGVKTVMVTIMC